MFSHVSQDPQFYERKKTKFLCERSVIVSTYNVFLFSKDEKAPFSTLTGLETSIRVVAMPTYPVMGYL